MKTETIFLKTKFNSFNKTMLLTKFTLPFPETKVTKSMFRTELLKTDKKFTINYLIRMLPFLCVDQILWVIVLSRLWEKLLVSANPFLKKKDYKSLRI